MKKSLYVIVVGMVCAVLLTACGGTTKNEDAVTPKKTERNPEKTLVVYFSMPETLSADNMSEDEASSTVVIDGKVYGNTQYVAQVIQAYTKADSYRIVAAQAYPSDHDTLVDIATQEQTDDARPAIKDQIENIDQYDTIYIGYPIWWSDMPMIMYTFFDTYDLSGKTIIPFSTHGGSGLVDTVETIQQLEEKANVLSAYSISRDDVEDAKDDIIAWLKQ